MRNLLAASLVVAALGASAAGCNDVVEQPELFGPMAFAMTQDTPPAIMVENEDGETTSIFAVFMPVVLPIRAPENDEMASLMATPANAPWMMAPWVNQGDIGVSVEVVMTNLDDEEREIFILLEARNEFYQHVPMISVDEEGELVAQFSSYQKPYVLPASSRTRWVIREEEIEEVETDFATVINGAPLADQVFYWENQSTRDDRTRSYIPRVVPGLVGFQLGIRSNAAANIAVEMTIRLIDRGDRLAREGDRMWMTPEPMPFTPMPPPEEE